VPKGYRGYAAADDNAAVVWTNLSEKDIGIRTVRSMEHPDRFTLVARPAGIGVSGIDARFRESGVFSEREREKSEHVCAPEARPVIRKFKLRAKERIARLWVSPSSRRKPSE